MGKQRGCPPWWWCNKDLECVCGKGQERGKEGAEGVAQSVDWEIGTIIQHWQGVLSLMSADPGTWQDTPNRNTRTGAPRDGYRMPTASAAVKALC